MAGLIAWRVPQVLGVGYGYVGDALNNKMTLELMALLVVFKLVAVTTSYASGNAGGIFGPSLFIGAMLGGTLGSVVHHLWPATRPPRERMRLWAWAPSSQAFCARR